MQRSKRWRKIGAVGKRLTQTAVVVAADQQDLVADAVAVAHKSIGETQQIAVVFGGEIVQERFELFAALQALLAQGFICEHALGAADAAASKIDGEGAGWRVGICSEQSPQARLAEQMEAHKLGA